MILNPRVVPVFLLLLTALPAAPAQSRDKPSLDILMKRGKPTFVVINVPGIEGVGVDLWCYEDNFRQPTNTERKGDSILLTHESEGNKLETILQPVADGVDITLTLTGPDEETVKKVKFVNLCATYQRSAAFGNTKDKFDESYLTDFVGRAFLFLDRGLTRLVDTERIPSVDPRDNPFSAKGRAPRPWVQEYIPAWRKRADFVNTFYGKRPLSTDRPVYPIIGVISHDQRFMSAIAWPECQRLGQLFISCLHPSPLIEETYDRQTNRCVTRGKIYFMENNPERLLESFRRDFPNWRRPPDAD
jgi:hypothetical protein